MEKEIISAGSTKTKKENIFFIGRLAEYKYYDMDEAVKIALVDLKNLLFGNFYYSENLKLV